MIEMDAATQRNLDLWLNGHYDAETKAAIRLLLEENPTEAVNAFYTNLTFGTGGLRALMGVGCNRLNRYTIMTATQGLANYIQKQPSPEQLHSVYIGYDCRYQSRYFAETAAKVLAANGIRVYLSKQLCPTPLVSFGLRLKKCTAAIIITASHNPPQYNGYKVYWSDGGQVLSPHDRAITQEFNSLTDPSMIKNCEDLSHDLIEEVGEEVTEAYLKAIYSLQSYPKDNFEFGKKLKVVYTSLHGTGITLMPQTLSQWGFTNLVCVEEQAIPDGGFPTTTFQIQKMWKR